MDFAAWGTELRVEFDDLYPATRRLGIDPDRIVAAILSGYSTDAVVNVGNALEAVLKAVWRDLRLAGDPREKTLEPLLARCRNALKDHEAFDRVVLGYMVDIQNLRNREVHDIGETYGEDLTTRDALEATRKLAVVLGWYQCHFVQAVQGQAGQRRSSAAGGAQSASDVAGDVTSRQGLFRLAAEMVDRRRLGSLFTVYLGTGAFLASGAPPSESFLRAAGAREYHELVARLNGDDREGLRGRVLTEMRSSLPSGFDALGALIRDGWIGTVVTSNVDDFVERGLDVAGLTGDAVDILIFREGEELEFVGRLNRPTPGVRVVKLAGDFASGSGRWCSSESPISEAAAGVTAMLLAGPSLVVGHRPGDVNLAVAVEHRGDSIWLIDAKPALAPDVMERLSVRRSLDLQMEVDAPSVESVFVGLADLLSRAGAVDPVLNSVPGVETAERTDEATAEELGSSPPISAAPGSRRRRGGRRRMGGDSSAVPDQVVPGTELGNYAIEELLGRGTHTSVYRAMNRYTDAVVAVKILARDQASDEAARASFFHSARMMGLLSHPNVVRVYDTGMAGPWCYYAMEVVEGPTLETAMGTSALSATERWAIAEQLLAAVDAAHRVSNREPVVHGGLKPADVLLSSSGVVKLGNFGVGPRPNAWALGRASLPMDAASFYCAPEVRRGSSIAAIRDPRVDVFALGRLLLRLFTGIAPVEHEVMRFEIGAGGVRMLLSMSGLPGAAISALAATVARATDPFPDRRFASAGEVSRAVRRAREEADAFAAEDSGLEAGEAEIPAGEYVMGSRPDEPQRGPDEVQHSVIVATPLRMSRTPVTVLDWARVWGEDAPEEGRSRLPVERVSWWDAVAYCNALSTYTGRTPAYRLDDFELVWDEAADGFRLPTEEEWEYAARAGTVTAYCAGDSPADLAKVGWYDENSSGRLHEVASLGANDWGIFDVHGNVWEWCWDWYGPYETEGETDENRPSRRTERVLRGGSCRRPAAHCRSAHRYFSLPGNRGRSLGFRVVRRSGPPDAVQEFG